MIDDSKKVTPAVNDGCNSSTAFGRAAQVRVPRVFSGTMHPQRFRSKSMKKTAVLSLLALIATIFTVALSIVQADTPNEYPEFYFTRLVYQENGMRSPFTMKKP